jgi:hypothetical protein
MRRNLLWPLVAVACLIAQQAAATLYWPSTTLTQWDMFVNNGVVYIQSPQFASHCTYSRGEIQVGNGPYERAMYAYALSAKARNKSLNYVVDDAATICVIKGLMEV